MSKGPAKESTLGDLHNKVATVMLSSLDNIQRAQDAFADIPVEQLVEDGVTVPEINPALLSVMVRFLDANKITCAPETSETMTDLEKRLAERRSKRRQVGNVVHAFQDE